MRVGRMPSSQPTPGVGSLARPWDIVAAWPHCRTLAQLHRVTWISRHRAPAGPAGSTGARLAEEAEVWLRELDWDFQGSAALVRRFLDMQALSGFCLLAGDRPAGYSYYVCESNKGLIGDLYIVRESATAAHEHRLLGAVLDTLIHSALVRRVESQTHDAALARAERAPMAGPRARVSAAVHAHGSAARARASAA